MPQVQFVDDIPRKPEPTGVQEFFSNLSREYKAKQDQDVFADILGKAQKNQDRFAGLQQAELDLARSNMSPSNRIQHQQQLSNMRKMNIEEAKVLNLQAAKQQNLVQQQAKQEAKQVEEQAQKLYKEQETQKTREALQKAGATPEQIALHEASTVGGQTHVTGDVLETISRNKTPEGMLAEGLVDYDRGLTPSERVKRQDSRYSIQAPMVAKNADSLRGLESEGLSIGMLGQLNDSGKVGEGFKLNINPMTGSLIIPALATPEEQLFVKTINDFTVKAKDSFGANVTNFEIDRFMQRLPSLANSKEGRALILRQMAIINELNKVEKDAVQKVFDEYGVRNIDYADAEKIARSKIKDSKESLRKEYMNINSILDKEETNASKQLKEQAKPGYKVVQKANGEYKQVPEKNVDAYKEKEAQSDEATNFDKIYGAEDLDVSKVKPTKGWWEWYKDNEAEFKQQFPKETLVGAGGTYGDLLNLVGVGSGNEYNPQKDLKDLETMKRMDQPGYQPTFADVDSLTSDQIVSDQFNLPTSQQVREGVESIGGPGSPTTPGGEFGKRAGGMFGAGLAAGQPNPVPPLAAGASGQAVKELGGGPLMQVAAEIATLLLGGKKGAPLDYASEEEVATKIKQLRELGYTDEQITLAINAANKGGNATRYASKSAKTQQAFEDFATKSDDVVNQIISKEIPGIENGISHVKEMASDAYGKVVSDAANVAIKDATPFVESVEGVIKHLSNNLGTNPEAQGFITRLTEAAAAATENPNADTMINFYKELNQMGKWLGRSERDHLIGRVKDGIKDTFKKQGKQGSQLAEEFEAVNAGVQKAYRAEDMMDILNKASVNEQFDMSKLSKLMEKKENIDTFKLVLGGAQTENLRKISNIGKQVKDFDKAWKGVIPFTEKVIAGSVLTPSLMHDLYSGNLFMTAGIGGATVIGRKLLELSLTSPKFQNLMMRGMHAIATNSPKSFRSVTEAMLKMVE